MTDKGNKAIPFFDYCSGVKRWIKRAPNLPDDAIWLGDSLCVSREQLAGLLPILQHFVETGELGVPHKWEALSVGMYDDTYWCRRCDARHSESADAPETWDRPVLGCVNSDE